MAKFEFSWLQLLERLIKINLFSSSAEEKRYKVLEGAFC
jgi:hypothetical protein